MFGNIRNTRPVGELLSVFDRLLNKSEQERIKKEKIKKEELIARDRAEGHVTNPGIVSLDAGTWDETYTNTKAYDSGEW